MKQRPILIAAIGYIIGIIMGLYFKISIVPFYISIIAIDLIKKIFTNKFKINKGKKQKFKIFAIRRYKKYLKVFINRETLIIIVVVSIISNTYILFQDANYIKVRSDLEKTTNLEIIGVIDSNKQEKDFSDVYILKIEQINGTNIKNTDKKLYISIKKNNKTNIGYGDEVLLKGEFQPPEVARNYKGFNYCNYLKTIQVYGTIKTDNIKKIDTNKNNKIMATINEIKDKIQKESNKYISKEEQSIYLGLILGDTTTIEENLKEDFRNSNISHILAVSGMHMSYIILGSMILFGSSCGKRKAKILTCMILIFYMLITGLSPSVTRAGIMGIILMLSGIFYRKNDFPTTISISALIILIYNPYLILNMGFQFSYLGTIGIVLFHKNIYNLLSKIKPSRKNKYRINRKLILILDKIKKIVSVIISAQIATIPLIIYYSNIFNIYSIFINFIISIIIGPIVILGIIFSISIFLNTFISKIIATVFSLAIKSLIFISQISNNLPFSKIYIPTPSSILMIIFFIIVILINYIIKIYTSKNNSQTQKRIRNSISAIKYKIKQNQRKVLLLIFLTIFLIISTNILKPLIFEKMKIYFIDVGQGDSTLIVTPKNKTILIDGGGTSTGSFDVGKKTLLPYILDRGFTKIDYIIISHFDNDHVRTGY